MTNLPDPPADISLLEKVKSRWEDIRRKVRRGEDVEFDIQELAQEISSYEQMHRTCSLMPEYNWAKDIFLAKRFHSRLLHATKQHISAVNTWHASTLDLADRNDALSRALFQDGLKYILLLHGATAIACLNAVFSANAAPYKAAMKFGMVGAFVGILLLIGGAALFLNTLSTQTSRVRGRLNNKKSFPILQSIYRWTDAKLGSQIKWSGALIMGSIVWFCLYIMICLLLVLDA